METHPQEATRPQTKEEVMGLHHKSNGVDEDRDVLFDLAETGHCKGLMFIGPAGTGKTSVARVWAGIKLGIPTKDVLNSRYYKEFNASGERGIDVIRSELQIFSKIPTPNGITRIVFLDEAGGLTKDAQRALKNISEKYAYNCIFIYAMNNPQKVIDPLFSRCKQFYFDPIDRDSAKDWLLDIMKLYHVEYTSNVPDMVLDYYKGDLRKIVSDFIVHNEGRKVTTWNPRPTYAEEIYKAKNKYATYLSLARKHYIPPKKLLEDLYILSGRKNPVLFLKADMMLAGGGSPEIAIGAALSGI